MDDSGYNKYVFHDKKTSNYVGAIGEAFDVEAEVYCRRRSGNFWRMRASLGLACAQAAPLGTQSPALAPGLARQRAPVPEHRLPVMGLCLRPQRMQPFLCTAFFSFLFLCFFCSCVSLSSYGHFGFIYPACVASRSF